jgi:hypothetical protein
LSLSGELQTLSYFSQKILDRLGDIKYSMLELFRIRVCHGKKL